MDNMTPTSEVIRLAREADCLYVNLTVDPTLDAERLGRLISLAKAEEREACAQAAEQQIDRWVDDRARYAARECAAAIRARTQEAS